MNTAKNIFLFFFSFILMGLFVLLLDQMYPTAPMGVEDSQAYTHEKMLMEASK